MESLINFQGAPGLSSSVLLFLLGITLKSILILLAAFLCTRLMRRASSATRHLLWSMALAAILLLPLLGASLPSWNVSFLPVFPSIEKTIPETGFSDSFQIPTEDHSSSSEMTSIQNQKNEKRSLVDNRKTEKDILAPLNKGPMDSSRLTALKSGMNILLIIWLLGIVILFMRLLAGKMIIWRLTRKSEKVTEPSWLNLSLSLIEQFQIKRSVCLLKSSRVKMPMTWGLKHPKILLPATAEFWSGDQRRLVLMHEFAHVKRLDSLTQFLSLLSVTVQWFNPFMWFSYRQFLKEREQACDDFVLKECSQATEYAGLLLNIARSFSSARVLSQATVAMARRKQLEGRLLAILNPDAKRQALTRFSVLFMGAAVLFMVLPLAALKPLTKGSSSKEIAVVTSERKTESRPETKQTAQEKERASLVVKSLAEALNDPDPEVRLEAARTLGSLKNKEAVPALISALKDADREMRLCVIEALGDIKDRRSVEALITLLKDEDWNVRLAAVYALGDIEDIRAVLPLGDLMNDEAWKVRKETANALGQIGDPRAVNPLAAALKDKHHEVRRQVVESLGSIEDSSSVIPLISVLKDESWEVRKEAVEALGNIEDNRAVIPLGDCLSDKVWQIRKETAEALGDLADSRSVNVLISTLKDKHQEVRKEVASALGEIGDSKAVLPLCEALKDESWEVRREAAEALGEIGDPRAIEPLTARLKDKNEEVRRAAARALGDIEWKE